MLCICCTSNGVPRSGLKVRTPPLWCVKVRYLKNTKKIWGGAVPSPVGRDTPSACPSACGTSTPNSKNLGMSLSTVQQIHSKSDQYASVCLSVCLSVGLCLSTCSWTAFSGFSEFSVHVVYGRVSVILCMQRWLQGPHCMHRVNI